MSGDYDSFPLGVGTGVTPHPDFLKVVRAGEKGVIHLAAAMEESKVKFNESPDGPSN